MSEPVDLAYTLCWKGFDLLELGQFEDAEPLFEKSARMGYPQAMTHLGNLYDDKLQPPQPLKAIHWYVRAFRAGEYSAAWNLAMHYVPRNNRRWHRFWIERAADAGHEHAMTELAKLRVDPNYITILPLIEQDNEPYEDEAD